MRTAASVSFVRSIRPPDRNPIAPVVRPIPFLPVSSSIASLTVLPPFTLSIIKGGYANPGPWPRVTHPRLSTTAQYCTSRKSRTCSFQKRPASIPTP